VPIISARGNRSKLFPGRCTSGASETFIKRDASMTKILPTVGRVVWFTPSRLTGDYGFTHISTTTAERCRGRGDARR
jgi:hypothetical protein